MLRRHVRYSCIYAACMGPALYGNFALWHFQHGKVIELHNGMIKGLEVV